MKPDTAPSSEAIALAVQLSGHTHCERAWKADCDSSNVCDGCLGDAAKIDRELALPQRNAALLLSQALIDAQAAASRPSAIGAAERFARDMDALLPQLRDALAKIK